MDRLPPGFGFTSRRRTGSLVEAAVEGLGIVSPAAAVLVPEVSAGGTMDLRPLPLPRPLPLSPLPRPLPRPNPPRSSEPPFGGKRLNALKEVTLFGSSFGMKPSAVNLVMIESMTAMVKGRAAEIFIIWAVVVCCFVSTREQSTILCCCGAKREEQKKAEKCSERMKMTLHRKF